MERATKESAAREPSCTLPGSRRQSSVDDELADDEDDLEEEEEEDEEDPAAPLQENFFNYRVCSTDSVVLGFCNGK